MSDFLTGVHRRSAAESPGLYIASEDSAGVLALDKLSFLIGQAWQKQGQGYICPAISMLFRLLLFP